MVAATGLLAHVVSLRNQPQAHVATGQRILLTHDRGFDPPRRGNGAGRGSGRPTLIRPSLTLEVDEPLVENPLRDGLPGNSVPAHREVPVARNVQAGGFRFP